MSVVCACHHHRMRLGRTVLVAMWLFLLGCSGSDGSHAADAAPDARPDATVRTDCTCCTQLPFVARAAYDVASDGTTIYVSFLAPGASQQQLGIVSAGGGAPTMVAVADSFVLAAFQDAVFYAARSGTSYELHQRVGTTDSVLGSLISVGAIQIAGNATDLYVFGSDTPDTSTLWRYSRSAGPGTMPSIVTTVAGGPIDFALGSTVAALQTSSGDFSGSFLVSVPGPSTPTTLPGASNGLVFSGDEGFVLRGSLLTTHASSWSINAITPTTATVWVSSIIINGGADELQADANHLYLRLTSGSEGTPNVFTRDLLMMDPDGTNQAGLCDSWTSDLLRQDASHLYGLEAISPDHWVVDVLAKP
jgi:hypothetical protein